MIFDIRGLLPPQKKEICYFSAASETAEVLVADINRLPNDILSLVFETLFAILRVNRAEYHYIALGALRLVSREWDELLRSRSEFWVRLSLDQDSAGWDVVLKYNLTSFIEVFASLQGEGWPWTDFPSLRNGRPRATSPDPKATKFMKIVTREVHRIKHLDMSYDGVQFRVEDIIRLVCSPAPILETVHLVTPSRLTQSPAHRPLFPISNIFGGNAAMLRSVDIQSEFTSSLIVPAFLGGQLEYLALGRMEHRFNPRDTSDHPAIDFLPEVLCRSPNLRYLRLSGCTLSSPVKAAAILLDKLHDLFLKECDENLALLMFDAVQAPACKRLILETKVQPLLEAHQAVSQRMADHFLPRDGRKYYRSLVIRPFQVIQSFPYTVSIQYSWSCSQDNEFGLTSVLPRMACDVRSAITSIFLDEETGTADALALLHHNFPLLSEIGLDCRGARWGDPRSRKYSDIGSLTRDPDILPNLRRFKLIGEWEWQIQFQFLDVVKLLQARQERRNDFGGKEVGGPNASATIVVGDKIPGDILEDARVAGIRLEFDPGLINDMTWDEARKMEEDPE